MGIEKWMYFWKGRGGGGGGGEVLTKAAMSEEEEEEEECCSVCLMRMVKEKKRGGGGEEVKTLGCSHVFHRSCVERWFHVCGVFSCPLCRFSSSSAVSHDLLLLPDDLLLWFSSFHF
ncbi:PREDICTED: E3 ubiquitin-protein ligase RHA2A [Tarenaya hassleriana]|uniref:E3 ubiquitin-protein ligase RHA2A n=1 Tax=Tarenaya hassleriana TaxID=28532 RepID=UPI0008FD6C8B|nr:PREDICTED: E3 ubiquitin-protein ligase RHA2A [Tarenaya hassleriana]